MAGVELTGRQIAEMAVAIEERGAAFYAKAAKGFEDPKVSQAFLKLAEEEKEHARIFRRLFTGLKEENNAINPVAVKFIKSIHGNVIPVDITTPQNALVTGIQAEKDAILFYQELYNHTESEEARAVLSKLLEEEKMHLVDLRSYLEEI